MKKQPMFQLLFSLAALLCTSASAHAQRYLSERRPDLSLVSATVKRVDENHLNVIWSIKNVGDATAVNVDQLVALNLESSSKPNRTGEAHQWIARANAVPLVGAKKELKVNEITTGNCTIACSEKDLVSLRLSLYIEQDNYENRVDNNALITLLVGK
jgi:hypothetical protein